MSRLCRSPRRPGRRIAHSWSARYCLVIGSSVCAATTMSLRLVAGPRLGAIPASDQALRLSYMMPARAVYRVHDEAKGGLFRRCAARKDDRPSSSPSPMPSATAERAAPSPNRGKSRAAPARPSHRWHRSCRRRARVATCASASAWLRAQRAMIVRSDRRLQRQQLVAPHSREQVAVHSTQATPPAGRSLDHAMIPARALFGDALLRLIVHIDDAKAPRIAKGPLEIVHQRPDEIAAQLDAILDSAVRRCKVARADRRCAARRAPASAARGRPRRRAVLGDIERRGS